MIAERERQVALKVVELSEPVLAQREQEVRGYLLVRHDAGEVSGKTTVGIGAALVQEVLLKLIQEDVELVAAVGRQGAERLRDRRPIRIRIGRLEEGRIGPR